MHYAKAALRTVRFSTWVTAISISLFFLLFLAYFLDWDTLRREIQGVNWLLLCIAFLVLSLEGLFTALRIKVFTPGKQSLADCLKLTSWFVVMLVILPARAGELFVLVLYKHMLNQRAGMSIMNVIAQRILDVLVLSGVFLFVMLFSTREIGIYLYEVTIALILILTVVLLMFNRILELFSKISLGLNYRYKHPVFRKILRLLLQARTWYQHYMGIKKMHIAILLTIFKWTCNLAGLILVFYSLNLPIDKIEALFLSACYNFMGIVPLQGIGGIGFSEAGLAGLLVMFDIPVDVAASSSIFMRAVAIVNPFVFFSIVMMILLLHARFISTKR